MATNLGFAPKHHFRVAKVTLVAMSTVILTSAVAPAQQADVAPEIVARMAKEKEARHECVGGSRR